MIKSVSRAYSLICISLTLLFSASTNIYALEVTISGNSDGSQNTATVSVDQTASVVQTNDASIENKVETTTNTGGNEVSETTGGDNSNITTGDAAEEVNVDNSMNVSNVDIGCCDEPQNVQIVNNGSNTQNTVNVEVSSNTNVVVENKADIVNEVSGNANTGENKVGSTSGNTTIKTGDIAVNGSIKNSPVNIVNVQGGNSAPEMSLLISGNSPDSVNKIAFSSLYPTNIYMSSIYNAQNKVNWDLQTGGNKVENSMGDVNIITGDILFDFSVKNGPVNISGVDWDCCSFDPYDPGNDDPGDEVVPDDPGRGGGPSSDSNSSSGSSSSSSSSSSDSSFDGILGQILGLSDTSGRQAGSMLYMIGLILIVSGLGIVGKSTLRL